MGSLSRAFRLQSFEGFLGSVAGATRVALLGLVALASGGFVSAQVRSVLEVGYVEIKCEAGVAVFLDDEFKGTTNAEMGGFILQGVAVGSHTLRVVKEGFNPQSATIPVVAGKVYTFRVNPFTPQLQIEQSGSSGERNVVQKTGVLLVQTLPTNCTISVADVLVETEKSSDEFRVSNFPIGSYNLVVRALGKTVEAKFEVTSEKRTHLFVNLLDGKVEDRSLLIEEVVESEVKEVEAEQIVDGVSEEKVPVEVKQKDEKSQEEILAEATERLRKVRAELVEADRAIAEGVGGLDEVSDLVKRRADLLVQEKFSLALVEDAEAVLRNDRRKEFVADNAKFKSIQASEAVPANVKVAAWKELIEKWELPVGELPVELYWNVDRPDVARGSLEVVLSSRWPEALEMPALSIDGVEHVPHLRQEGVVVSNWLQGGAIEGVAAGDRVIRLTHPVIETFETTVSIVRDKAVKLDWSPDFLPAKVKLDVASGIQNWKARIGKQNVSAVLGDTFEIEPEVALELVVYAESFAPFFATVRASYGEVDTVDVAFKPMPPVGLPAKETVVVSLEKGVEIELLPCPAGSFVMGSVPGTLGEEKDEGPLSVVEISSPFWLGRTEVTQAQWKALGMRNQSSFKADDRPVETVSWSEADEFCKRLNERELAAGRLPDGYVYTLPTEAQWEYACRAGGFGTFSGRLDQVGWYRANSDSKTHYVGELEANAWGLLDMHGNVAEWCSDRYEDSYSGRETVDPTGAKEGTRMVFRGGSWNDDSVECRSAARAHKERRYRASSLGFRLCLSAGAW